MNQHIMSAGSRLLKSRLRHFLYTKRLKDTGDDTWSSMLYLEESIQQQAEKEWTKLIQVEKVSEPEIQNIKKIALSYISEGLCENKPSEISLVKTLLYSVGTDLTLKDLTMEIGTLLHHVQHGFRVVTKFDPILRLITVCSSSTPPEEIVLEDTGWSVFAIPKKEWPFIKVPEKARVRKRVIGVRMLTIPVRNFQLYQEWLPNSFGTPTVLFFSPTLRLTPHTTLQLVMEGIGCKIAVPIMDVKIPASFQPHKDLVQVRTEESTSLFDDLLK